MIKSKLIRNSRIIFSQKSSNCFNVKIVCRKRKMNLTNLGANKLRQNFNYNNQKLN